MKILKIFLLIVLSSITITSFAYDITGSGGDFSHIEKTVKFKFNGDNRTENVKTSRVYRDNKEVGQSTSTSDAFLTSDLFGDFFVDGVINIYYTGTTNCLKGQTWYFSGTLLQKDWGYRVKFDNDISNNYYCPTNNSFKIKLSGYELGNIILSNASRELSDDEKRAIDDTVISVGGLTSSKNVTGLDGQNVTEDKKASINLSPVGGTMFNLNTTIDKNIVTLTNGIEASSRVSTISNFDKDIMYYDFTGKAGFESNEGNKGKILPIAAGNSISVTGEKTLIVKGGNVYIKNNIYNSDNKSVLTIVVKRDKTNPNNGGNIYIDPSVTNIDALLIADGSIMSYDGSSKKVINANTSTNKLSNQLLIYGLIATKNTLAYEDLKLPYGSDGYRTRGKTGTNNLENYSLAFLRSFKLDTDGITPKNGGIFACGKPKFDGSCTEVKLRPTPKYNSLVIEYNPIIQTKTPKILLNSY